MTQSWFHWLRRSSARKQARRTRRTSRPRRSFAPQLLVLEERTVLSVLTVMSNGDSGAGSLRDTIAAAQSGDTIVFDPSVAYETITLSSGPLALSSNLMINGLGAKQLTISGNNVSQLFTLSGSAQVTLANLTLTGGMSSQGGAIFIGPTAALTLDNDILSGNQAVGDANNNAVGGAVFNSAGASLTITNTSFVNNQTKAIDESFGGAIANAGTLVIDGATFTGNAALGSPAYIASPLGGNVGGAIGNQDGAMATIKLTTFTGNQALANGAGGALGGAIFNEDITAFPFTGKGVTCTFSECTFANNLAKGGDNSGNQVGNGGAIEDDPGVNLTVINCSFTGNQANSGGGSLAEGGAIDNSPADLVTISNSQFISNSAIGSGLGAHAAAGAVDNFQTMTIDNCLFTGNSAVAGPMADGVNTLGQAVGGAIFTGDGLLLGVPNVVLTISNSILTGNEAIGGSGGSGNSRGAVGVGWGGGIFNGNGGTLNVVGCTITGNEALGGATGQGSGGIGLGGGIANSHLVTLNLTNSTVSSNLSQGGAGASGAAGGGTSGGGIRNDINAIAIITNCTVSLNECQGGAGGAGANGGEAVGGGIWNGDTSSLIVSSCQLIGNVAQGGTAGSSAQGGDALGGGLFAGSSTVVLEAVLVSGNQSQGGADSGGNTTGNGLGGGVYANTDASVTADMETLIAGNQASKDKNDVWGTITKVP